MSAIHVGTLCLRGWAPILCTAYTWLFVWCVDTHLCHTRCLWTQPAWGLYLPLLEELHSFLWVSVCVYSVHASTSHVCMSLCVCVYTCVHISASLDVCMHPCVSVYKPPCPVFLCLCACATAMSPSPLGSPAVHFVYVHMCVPSRCHLLAALSSPPCPGPVLSAMALSAGLAFQMVH